MPDIRVAKDAAHVCCQESLPVGLPPQWPRACAGAGGVGHLGTQLAKHRGAYVITTASLGNKLFCKVRPSVGMPYVCAAGQDRQPAVLALFRVDQHSWQQGQDRGLDAMHSMIGMLLRGCSGRMSCEHASHRLTGRVDPLTPRVQRNGADVVIDYKGERFDEILKNEPVDAVVDTVGGRALSYVQLQPATDSHASQGSALPSRASNKQTLLQAELA